MTTRDRSSSRRTDGRTNKHQRKMKSYRCVVEACAATCSFITRQLVVNKKVSSFCFFFFFFLCSNLCSTHPVPLKVRHSRKSIYPSQKLLLLLLPLRTIVPYFIYFNFDCHCAARYISLLDLCCRVFGIRLRLKRARILETGRPPSPLSSVGCFSSCNGPFFPRNIKVLFTTHLPHPLPLLIQT